MGADLRTPYNHIEEAGFESHVEDAKDLLGGDEWYENAIDCTPKTLAAGAVYYIGLQNPRMKKTQDEVAEAFDTTTISVRTGYRVIGRSIGDLTKEDAPLPHE